MNKLPPYDLVRELFDYDPQTGVLSWRVKRAQVSPGDAAGARRGVDGYLQVSIDRKLYRVHRIVWLWMTGSAPDHFLDHKDADKANNRWDNLRPATKSQNQANVGLTARNTSGRKGVFWHRASGRWVSQIWKDRTSYFLGYFDDPAMASAAYAAKAGELFGEFARVK